MILCNQCRADISFEEHYLCSECGDLLCSNDIHIHDHKIFTEWNITSGYQWELVDHIDLQEDRSE